MCHFVVQQLYSFSCFLGMNVTQSRHENIQLKTLQPQKIPDVVKKKPPVLLKIMKRKPSKKDSNQKCNTPIIIIGVKQKEESDGRSSMVFL